MQREFRTLVMSNIRRIAHSPREAERIAGILHMQVILVCVAHAALKTWIAARKASGDPGVDVMPEEIPAIATRGISLCEEDPAAAPATPLRALWDSFTGRGECEYASRAGLVFRWIPASGSAVECRD
jgi:hypothetical protein